MKIAIVFFTYSKDAELLKYALQGTQRLQENNPADTISVFIRDDAASPLPEIPDGVDYKQTVFDRQGNLNGLDCIAGMLAEYEAIAAQGYDWVVKADCDTYINNLEWLREQDAQQVDYVGTCHVHDYGSGACYALSAAGVKRIVCFMQSETVRKRVNMAYCEDRAICRMANICGRAVIKHCGQALPEAGKLYHDWWSSCSASFDALTTAYAVDFKYCRWHTTPEQYDANREKAITRMAGYVNFLANKPLTADS